MSSHGTSLNHPEALSPQQIDSALLVCLSRQKGMIFDDAGCAFIFDFANPERHWKVSEQVRLLMSCISPSVFRSVAEIVATYFRRSGIPDFPKTRAALVETIEQLLRAKVLSASAQHEQGSYTPEMCAAYRHSRAIPVRVCTFIAQTTGITASTRVLDIGTGPGELAISLGQISGKVTGMDFSDTFLSMAKSEAQAKGSQAHFARGDANKLLFSTERYDVVILSQVFHWLNPALAIAGFSNVLDYGGSLVFVETKQLLKREHPLRERLLFGGDDVSSVHKECERHIAEHQLRLDLLRPKHAWFNLRAHSTFCQRRSFDVDFTRAYFFDEHLAAVFPLEADPRMALEQHFRSLPPDACEGEMYWNVLCFTKAEAPEPRLLDYNLRPDSANTH